MDTKLLSLNDCKTTTQHLTVEITDLLIKRNFFFFEDFFSDDFQTLKFIRYRILHLIILTL